MIVARPPLRRIASTGNGRRRQRGVVLVVALLVMVAMALAAIAMMRSTDTATVFSGNLAFTRASMAAVDRSVEQAVHALFDAALVSDKTSNNLAQNYYAMVKLNADGSIPEIPAVLAEPFSASAFAAAGLSATLVPVDEAGNKSYYVIERMCRHTAADDPLPGRVGLAVGSNCNLSSAAFGADAGTQHYTGLVRPGDAFYRVTVRVEGPRDTVGYAQAILK